MPILSITDVSNFARYGVKGAQAAAWLAKHGVNIPEQPNAWVLSENTLILRLGSTEFLLEDQADADLCQKLLADNQRVPNVYQVPRADAAWILTGSDALNFLSEICTLNLRASALPENALVMTQVAGISATLLRQTVNTETTYRLWCDGTYGVYMRHVLEEIAAELIPTKAKT